MSRARISTRHISLTRDGNQINKRNAWQARSVLYVHAIPPGAADTVHYLLNIPKDAKGPIHLTAKLNHRKFSLVLHRSSLMPGSRSRVKSRRYDINHNAAEYSFDKANIPANVSGEVKGEIPVTPITVLAKAESNIDLTNNAAETKWTAGDQQEDARALERLGYRPAAAGRRERRRICLHESHRGRARLCRRLAERGAGAHSGRRNGPGQAIYREVAGCESGSGPHLLFPRADRKGGWRLRCGA